MSQKHTNIEIAQAKMLARRLAAARGVRTTLGVSGSLRFFLAASWTLLTHPFVRAWESLKQLFLSCECPHCFSARRHFPTEEPCKLCNGRGRITTHQQKAVSYGRALFDFRTRERRSAALAAYIIFGIEAKLDVPLRWQSYEAWWLAMENGYLPLHEWPDIALHVAQYEMLNQDL